MASILVVEDHALSRQMLSSLLGHMGHQVLEAADGASALMLARTEHPDLIISDVLLPGMDGPELARRLHEDSALRDISLVFYTATCRLPETLRLGVCGSFRVIPKPSDPAVIIQTIDQVLDNKQAIPQSSPVAAALPQVLPAPSPGSGLQLAAIMDMSISLAAERNPERLLEMLIRTLCQVIDCQKAVLAVYDADDRQRYYVGSCHEASMVAYPESAPSAAVLSRVRAGDRVRLRASMVLPFASPSRSYGWIQLTGKHSCAAFKDEDEEIAVALSTHAVLLYENTLLIQQLRKSEAQYRSMTRNMPSVLVRLDRDLRFLYINPKAEEITGIFSTGAIGQTVRESGMPLHLATMWENAVREVFRTGQDRSIEFDLPSDPDVKTLYLKLAPEYNLDGAVDHVLGMLTDITERKQAEEYALASEREFLKTTIDSLGEGVVVTDPEGCITLINEAAVELCGCARADAVGKPFDDVVHVMDDRHKFLALDKASEMNIDALLVRRNADSTPVTISRSPINTVDGKHIGTVWVFQDVTERKKAEQERLRAEKLKSLGILAGGIAHDFNNILTAMLMNLQLASLKLKNKESIERYLAATIESTQRASNLTKQLLTFSKGGDPVRKDASLTDMIRDTTEFVLCGANMRAEFDIPHDLWPACVDEGLISQVIYNLVINAKQATPNGGIIKVGAANVTIDSDRRLKPGRYVKIQVKDFGQGIPKDNLTKIFDPFFTTKREGNGLGLATSYSIIKKHNGLIEVESEEGVGTQFSIYLPASNCVAAPAEAKNDAALTGNGIRILLMDDEERILNAASEMLQCCGYQVVPATDGAEAINIYKQAKSKGNPFDLVIMDLTVPGGMGGQEALSHLRAFDPSIKAIVSSGYANDPIMAEYTRYGFMGVVSKPYKISELNAVLNDAMAN